MIHLLDLIFAPTMTKTRNLLPFSKPLTGKLVAAALASLASASALALPGFNACPSTVANGTTSTGCSLTGTQSITIENGGTLSGNGTSISGVIYIYSATSAGTVVNNGSIFSANGYGIGVESSASFGNIVNTGTISANSLAGVAILGSITSLTNSGTIAGGASGKAIYVMSASSHVTNGITNTGLLDGAVVLNDATLNLDGTSGRVTGAVSGAAGSTVNVNGTFTSESTFNVGSFNIASGGTFNQAHAVTASAGFANAGTLAVASDKDVTITGNYTQAAGGIYKVGVAGDATYGILRVTGTATLPSAAKIDVNVVGSPSLTVGGTLAGVLRAGTLSASTFSVTDNSTLFDFTAAANGNNVDLLTRSATTVFGSTSNMSNNPAGGAARVLDSLIAASPSGDMGTVVTALGSLGSEREVSNAASQTLPLLTGGMNQAANNSLTGTSRVIQARMDANRGASSGDTPLSDGKMWIKPYVSKASQGERNGVAGYDADTYGLVLGADGNLTPADRLGLALAYSRSNVDGKSSVARNSGDVEAVQAVVYGSHALDERTEISYQADLGFNQNKGDRQISFGGLNRTARADYDSYTGHAGAGLGRRYDLSERTSFFPAVRLDYTSVHDKGYTETGADALNLQVGKRTTEALVVSVDGRVAHKLDERSTLSANLGIGHDLINEQASITSSYVGGGAAFTTQGIKPSATIVSGGLGLSYLTERGVELAARYDIEARESFTNQTASLKMRMPF